MIGLYDSLILHNALIPIHIMHSFCRDQHFAVFKDRVYTPPYHCLMCGTDISELQFRFARVCSICDTSFSTPIIDYAGNSY